MTVRLGSKRIYFVSLFIPNFLCVPNSYLTFVHFLNITKDTKEISTTLSYYIVLKVLSFIHIGTETKLDIKQYKSLRLRHAEGKICESIMMKQASFKNLIKVG